MAMTARERERHKERMRADPEYRQRVRVRRARHERRRDLARLGATPEMYDDLFQAQQGVCAICGYPPEMLGKRLSVDHDHKTKKVRGLLCKACNLGLGSFRDDKRRLLRAVTYLEDHR